MCTGEGEIGVDKAALIYNNLRVAAEVAELADARDSKSRPGNRVRVRLPPSAILFASEVLIYGRRLTGG